MASEKSPIEMVCDHFRSADTPPGSDEVSVAEILVPEQCAEIYIGHKIYSLSLEEASEKTPSRTGFAELRKAVHDMEERFCNEVRSWKDHENAVYNNFEVLSTDLASRVIVLCRATGLEDLFDQLAPWQGGDGLDWEQKALVVRALKAATPVAESLDLNLTPEFECGEYLPKIYIQMS